jgi:hypothetical protein
MDETASTMDQALLKQLRRRRVELHESINALESALEATSDDVRWVVRVHVALVELSADLTLHVRITEGDGGLHEELRQAAPRLSGAVNRLVEDHVRIRGILDELLLAADGPFPTIDAAAVRERAAAIIAALAQHRQRGADLIYEAFQVDIGGET